MTVSEWLPALIILFFAGVALYHRRMEQKYEREIKEFASRNGYDYEPLMNEEVRRIMAVFPFFQSGRQQGFHQVLSREIHRGRHWIFEFRYMSGYGRQRTRTRQTVVAVQAPGLRLPQFDCRRGGKLGSFFMKTFGFKDINFEADPYFSDHYHLSGKDEQAVRDLFERTCIREVLKRERDLQIQGDGDAFALFRVGKREDPDEMIRLTQLAEDFLAMLTG